MREHGVLRSALAMAVLLLLASCSWLGGDAADHREQKQHRRAVEGPDALMYRAIKITLRSSAIEGEKDESTREVRRLTKSLTDRVVDARSDRDGDGSVDAPSKADYVAAARELHALRDELRAADEDSYPTLLARIHELSGSPPEDAEILEWYTADHEHLVLAGMWLAAGSKVPSSFAVYEVSKLDPTGIDDPSLRLLAHAARGGTYLRESWSSLAEAEADAYLVVLESERPRIIADSRARGVHERVPTGSDEEIVALWHAPGVLIRGLARLRKGETDTALADLEAFLADSKTLGVDDELVWLASATLAIHRGDYDAATVELRKLEASDALADEDKALIRQAIADLETGDEQPARNAVANQVLLARVAGRYVVDQVGEVDWRKRVADSDSGKKLEELGTRMSQETQRVRESLGADELEELSEQAKTLGEQLKSDAETRSREWTDKAVGETNRQLDGTP